MEEEQAEEQQEQLEIPKKRSVWKTIIIWVLIIFGLLIIAGVYFYFSVISPSFVTKPRLDKPPLENTIIQNSFPGGVNNNSSLPKIEAGHIIYLLNEMEVYKLHDSPGGDIPKIYFVISNTNQEFFFSVKDNTIIELTDLSSPDIKIISDVQTIVYVYNLEEAKLAIMEKYNSGKINVEILADTSTLALKGYKSVADYFGITGFSILKSI